MPIALDLRLSKLTIKINKISIHSIVNRQPRIRSKPGPKVLNISEHRAKLKEDLINIKVNSKQNK
jgi:hypothetical protein